MAEFVEGSLAFEFGAAWGNSVRKFDEETDYRNVAHVLPGTKGVDFLGVCSNQLYFIEVKDFRGYRIQNKERLSKGKLVEEVGQKVRDSVACIMGAARVSSRRRSWYPYVERLLQKDLPIRVILWLEQDRFPGHARRERVRQNIQGNQLKQKLKWLGVKVDVHSRKQGIPSDLDLIVHSLPR